MAQPTLTPSDLPPDIEFIGSFRCLDSRGIRHCEDQRMINSTAVLETLPYVFTTTTKCEKQKAKMGLFQQIQPVFCVQKSVTLFY